MKTFGFDPALVPRYINLQIGDTLLKQATFLDISPILSYRFSSRDKKNLVSAGIGYVFRNITWNSFVQIPPTAGHSSYYTFNKSEKLNAFYYSFNYERHFLIKHQLGLGLSLQLNPLNKNYGSNFQFYAVWGLNKKIAVQGSDLIGPQQ
ncbi:MAG: hypothetical protein GC181_07075 [Bacteroidetes bacterium]|nr:hypothetical protein [Bacteroidota bacterium]